MAKSVHNVNIIHINKMINSAIQQGSNGKQEVVLSKDQAEEITGFLTSIDGTVELRQIEHALINGQSNIKNLVDDYHNRLLVELRGFKIEAFEGLNPDNPWGDKVCEIVEEMTSLQNDFIQLYKVILDNNSVDVDITQLLEQLLQFNFQDYDSFGYKDQMEYLRNDNYRIFIHEVFLNVVAYLLSKQKYEDLEVILKKNYQVKCVHNEGSSDQIVKYNMVQFPRFNYPVSTVNDKHRRIYHKILLHSKHLYRDLLIERAKTRDFISINQLAEADLLLYYTSFYHVENDDIAPHIWLTYFSDRNTKLDIMLRSVSKGFFNKINGLFDVDSYDLFYNKLSKIVQWQQQFSWVHEQNRVPDFVDLPLNLQELCTQP